jgi:hypothetical protein
MASITITKIQTMSQKTFISPTRFFKFPDDALALEVFVSASPDLVALPRVMFQAVFQIIDSMSNTVVFNRSVLAFFEDGPEFWLLLGNNNLASGSLTHPSDFGLTKNWDEPMSGRGLYGFRAIMKALQIQQVKGFELLVALDAFDISDIQWFRIAPAREQSYRIDDLIGTGIWPGESGVSAQDDEYPGNLPFRHGGLVDNLLG